MQSELQHKSFTHVDTIFTHVDTNHLQQQQKMVWLKHLFIYSTHAYKLVHHMGSTGVACHPRACAKEEKMKVLRKQAKVVNILRMTITKVTTLICSSKEEGDQAPSSTGPAAA
jgi:hypothetical protein